MVLAMKYGGFDRKINKPKCLLFSLIFCSIFKLREAFQSKKQRNLGISPNQKSPNFQFGKVQN